MSSRYQRVYWISFLILLAGAALSAPPPSDESARTEERFLRQLIALTNAERSKQKMPPLKLNPDLCAAAQWLARDMADHGHFEHTDSKGRDLDPRLPDFGFKNYETLSENIAAGLPTPEAVLDEWMRSPDHRANILDPKLREIGAGYARSQSSKFKHYWVLDLGSLMNGYPVVINDESGETHSPHVTLTLYGEGWAKQTRLSNDAKSWTDWEPFRSKRDWTLEAGAGKHTVYVELSNGRSTKRCEDSIQLVEEPLNKSSSVSSIPSAPK